MEKQSRRERNKLQCRRRIPRASRQLFSAKGYEETTMEDVAERADVSKATLYNYFPGKDSLLTGIAEAELEDINSLIAWELREEQSPAGPGGGRRARSGLNRSARTPPPRG